MSRSTHVRTLRHNPASAWRAGNAPGHSSARDLSYSPDDRRSVITDPRLIAATRRLEKSPKRLIDLALSASALAFLAPFIGLAALALKLSDGGPVFAAETLVGRLGKPFTRWRFRTGPWARAGQAGERARAPAAGKVIRALGLEGAPSIWNVWRGEMSLVGPAPASRVDLDQYGKNRRYYLLLRPGLTGLWRLQNVAPAASTRGEQDRFYLESWSWRRDVEILGISLSRHFDPAAHNLLSSRQPPPHVAARALNSVRSGALKIFVHDYAGHPFQAELSRELARRGHEVVHAFFADDQGPKGALAVRPGDPSTLRFLPLTIGQTYTKTNFVKRRFQDVRYGAVAAEAIKAEAPHVVISGNTPVESQTALLRASKSCNARFVFWVQDLFSVAASKLLTKKLPGAGNLVGLAYTTIERWQMNESNGVVLITDDFLPLCRRWGVSEDKIRTIPNWGAIDEIPLLPKDNAWAKAHGLDGKTVFLYSGTIGLKHNPGLLAALCERYRDNPDVQVVVAAAGSGVSYLQERKDAGELPNLTLLPLQPFADFPAMLASADVFCAVLERDAGVFSAPSKVLSYLCAARPILLAAPLENIAARIVGKEGAGLVVPPEDEQRWLAAADKLLADPSARAAMGARGRAYAEANFDIGAVTDKFEAYFKSILKRRRSTSR